MTNLPQYFGAAYLINLLDRKDRLEASKRELKRVGWNIGSNDIECFPARKFLNAGGFPNAGTKGAFYSHWDCFRRAQAAQSCGVLILEDDITFTPALTSLTRTILEQLNGIEWDFVFFGHFETGSIQNASAVTKAEDFSFSVWNEEIQGLHFYGVHSRILGRLESHLKKVAEGVEGDQVYGPMPIDGALNIFRRLNPGTRTLIACPKLGWQRPSRSDITPKRIDQYRVLRPLAAALRKIKHKALSWRP